MPTITLRHVHKSYIIKVSNCIYTIYSVVDGKWKRIRSKGTYCQWVNTHMGKMYKTYESDVVALSKAKEYIDNLLNKTHEPIQN